MAKSIGSLLGKIHHSDCVAGLKKVPTGSVDLAFADPPFNIGYDYDVYDDQLECQRVSRLVRQVDGRGASRAEAQRHVLAGHWRRVRRRAEGDARSGARVSLPQLGRLVLHVRRQLQDQVQPLARPPVPLGQGPGRLHVQRRRSGDPRVPRPGSWSTATSGPTPTAGCPTTPGSSGRRTCPRASARTKTPGTFPASCGTFKERAGWHGCQMPEQLLGRIIRACSNEGDLVLDPFAGSGTTLAVAKKLDRRFLGFELSKEYVKLGSKRLKGIAVGDELDGSKEPKVSAPATGRANRDKKSRDDLQTRLVFAEPSPSGLATEAKGIVEAFASANRGYSVDRLVADPILNEDFQVACQRRSLPGTVGERNQFLFRLRKAGKLKAAGVNTTARTCIDWEHISPFVFASEIAWRLIANKYCDMSLDEIFCDPRIASQFDQLAENYAPGHQPLDYRWAALKLRKEGSQARQRAMKRTARQLEITKFKKAQLKKLAGTSLANLDFSNLPVGPGVYLVQQSDGKSLFAGEAQKLRQRLETQFDPAGPQSLWLERGCDLAIHWLPVSSTIDYRLARQSMLLKWHQPQWNQVENLAC